MAEPQPQVDPRPELEQEKEDLERRLRELAADEDAAMDFDENFADSAQVAAEQGENRALASSLAEQLDEVNTALHRLDAGTYGVCEVCGESIARERLEAMPATARCIAHA